MAGYDIRTMTGHEVLVGMVNSHNPSVNFDPAQVTFTNLVAAPIAGRPGRTQVTMAVIGYRGTVLLTYGRLNLASAFTDAKEVFLLGDATQADLIATLNTQYNLNLGEDDYLHDESPLNLNNGSVRTYVLRAGAGSYVWYGDVTFTLYFDEPRLMEDGSYRTTEDGEIRMMES